MSTEQQFGPIDNETSTTLDASITTGRKNSMAILKQYNQGMALLSKANTDMGDTSDCVCFLQFVNETFCLDDIDTGRRR